MKTHVLNAHQTFKDGCARAHGLRRIFEYLRNIAPPALNCDDVLRSSLVLAVSSFDLFMHDIFRLEVVHRLQTKKEVPLLHIPFNVIISSEEVRIDMIEDCIRNENSYKSFVAPDKLAECLRLLFDGPWEKIAVSFGDDTSACKAKLKSVVDLRNRIAHQADVNPAYGGVGLWPIYNEDVDASIMFLERLGEAIADVVDKT